MTLDERDLTGYDETLPINSRSVVDASDAVIWESELVPDAEAAERFVKIREQNDRIAREELAKGFAVRVNEMY